MDDPNNSNRTPFSLVRVFWEKGMDLAVLGILGAAGLYVGQLTIVHEVQQAEIGKRLSARYEQQHKALSDALVAAQGLQNAAEYFADHGGGRMKAWDNVDPKDLGDYKDLVPKAKELNALVHMFESSFFLDESDTNKIHCILYQIVEGLNEGRQETDKQVDISHIDVLFHDLAGLYRTHTDAAESDMSTVDAIRAYRPVRVLYNHSDYVDVDGNCRPHVTQSTPRPG